MFTISLNRFAISILFASQFIVIPVTSRDQCNFPVLITCQSEEISITLCLDQDPTTCTNAAQCNILGVYDTVKDPHYKKNEIVTNRGLPPPPNPGPQPGPQPGPIPGPSPPIADTLQVSYEVFQTKLGFVIIDNLYPLDVFGVGFDDAKKGASNLYYDILGNLRVVDNNLFGGLCALSTAVPTFVPTAVPSRIPTGKPITTKAPTALPTSAPSAKPTTTPTNKPTATPTSRPNFGSSSVPTDRPSFGPTSAPTSRPSVGPTAAPTSHPSLGPTAVPTHAPTAGLTAVPTAAPTAGPTAAPTVPTAVPTAAPTAGPTAGPTPVPTHAPTAGLTAVPTAAPTAGPTAAPTVPTAGPTAAPTVPTAGPTAAPTAAPTAGPTAAPTAVTTAGPTAVTTAVPTATPTFKPTPLPTSIQPVTAVPNKQPITSAPTSQPSLLPTAAPTCAAVATTNQALFTVKQQLSNLTSSYFSGSSKATQAFTVTVAAVLGCTAPTTVTVTGSSRRRLQQAVPVTSVDYKVIFGFNGPPSAAYNALVAAIDNAVTTGHFTALLRSHASLVGVSALDLPTFSNYTVLPSDTNSNNGSASTAASSSSAGVIAGSVVAVLVALFACLLLVCCCRRVPADKKKAGDELHPDVFTVWRERLFPHTVPAANEAEPQREADVEHASEVTQGSHKSAVATSIASLFKPKTTMSVGSDKSLVAAIDVPAVEQADTESESKEPDECTPTRQTRSSSRVVIPMNLLPPTINRQVQPSSDPSSRVPPLPGRQPRRSIKYSFFKRRGSRGSESSKMETMSFRSSASHTGTLADLDLALGRFSIERELERQRYHEEYDRGDDAHSQTSDGGSGRESSVAWDVASVMSGNSVGGLDFPIPFRGDPLSQVNVQIGWHCLHADGKYLVEVSESPSNLTSFLLEGRRLKALNMPCAKVDSGFFHYASYDDLKGFVLRQLPFSATSCLGRYEDQILLMVTDVRHNLQKDASKKPLWRWVAKELTPDDTIQSGASILVIVVAKSTKP